MLNNIIKEIEVDMQKAIGAFKIELSKLRTGRAHTSLVEGVKVDYYGNETALQHIANIAVSDSRTITVTPWEKNMVKPIEKAIFSAGLGLNPVSDANLVRVPIPPLTEERRKEMAKVVKNIGETARVAVRNVRREAMDKLKDLLKKKEIDEDMDHRIQDAVQKTTDKFVAEIDKLMTAKEEELMKV
ncbi:MAG TPA: ribosome recycling factor [Coxiellaceae bacterium]|nr:MAG: ribosome recycling factor [Gammaproteobacteria bacterium RBG_16_37_9]HBC71538.1 ribosome recycling factor [Coxiellaceae bacterium]HBS51964.1 ribosome recycling factor [Coxiellaceae bacterium]HBY55337.1 ribosome recycling factor [Coxiellaceae bacterium]